MNKIKTKWYIFGGIFLCFAIFCSAVFLIKPVSAEETTSTTFPVDEAGIAAYVKLDSVENINIYTDLAEVFHSIEKQGESYVIGWVEVENKRLCLRSPYSYPHLYIGLDGWVIAYYLRNEEASRIMQWKGYEKGAINTTTLQDAIDIVCANIGVTYPIKDIKYYDFEFPNANKMTMIAEEAYPSYRKNGFSVTIPGTLYEGSYSLFLRTGVHAYGDVNLSINGDSIHSHSCRNCSYLYHAYYNIATQLQVNQSHFIELYAGQGGSVGAATVLIYQN